MNDDPIRPEIVKWTGPREALRPDDITAAPILDDGELLDRLLVICRDVQSRLEDIGTGECEEVRRWMRAEVGALLVARASYQPDPASIRMDDLLDEYRDLLRQKAFRMTPGPAWPRFFHGGS